MYIIYEMRVETIVRKVILIMPTVKVNDIQIYYEVHGDGFPLIMIMGLGTNVDWWDPRMIQKLSKINSVERLSLDSLLWFGYLESTRFPQAYQP